MQIDFSTTVLYNCAEITHVVGSVVYRCLESLESHHNLGLHFNSLIVVILIPDFFVLIKAVDLFIEVSTRE